MKPPRARTPVTHVGKIYNVVARGIAETLVATIPEIAAAQCLMVSRIGSPITIPEVLQIKLAMQDGFTIPSVKKRVYETAADHLGSIPNLIDGFIGGTIDLY